MPLNPHNLKTENLRGILPATTESVIFVDSGTGNVSGDGSSHRPFSTIEAAFNMSGLSSGDVIVVHAGHSETISAAAGIDADVAGVTVIGLGTGSTKPTITFDTATTADIDIDAANITFKNLRFVSDINDLAIMLDVNDDYFTIEDCDFVTSSAKECFNFINLATTKDFLTVLNCAFYQPTDPAGTDAAANTGGIYLVDSEHILVKGCKFIGQFETAMIHNKTTKCQDLVVEDCYYQCDLATSVPLELVAAVTGHMSNSYCHVPGAADVSVANVIGTIGATFWIAPNTYFSNDSAAGGELMVNSAAATS